MTFCLSPFAASLHPCAALEGDSTGVRTVDKRQWDKHHGAESDCRFRGSIINTRLFTLDNIFRLNRLIRPKDPAHNTNLNIQLRHLNGEVLPSRQ